MLYSYLSSSALETLLDSSALSRLNFLISSFKIRISSSLSLYCTSPVYLTYMYFVSNGVITLYIHYTYIIYVHTVDLKKKLLRKTRKFFLTCTVHYTYMYIYMYITTHTCTFKYTHVHTIVMHMYMYMYITYMYVPLLSVDCWIFIFSYSKASSSLRLINCVPRISLSLITFSNSLF